MSVRKSHYGAFTGAAAVVVLSATAITTPTPEPAVAVGLVSKPLTADQQSEVEALASAAYADQEANLRMRAEVEARQAEERRIAAARAAAAAAREQVLANADNDPKAVARMLLLEQGMGEDQFSCLNQLWEKESNWRVTADNPTSSAYGIPQALPGNRMAAAGADWETNPVTQITWGLDYIGERYGTPCKAWNHSQATNWY